MKRLWKFLKNAALIAVLCAAAIWTWIGLTSVEAKDLPPLKTADIIFQTSGSSQSSAILAASRSPLTHVGMIMFADDGSLQVIEAVEPVKITPLNKWIDRGVGNRIIIKRYPSISVTKANAVIAAAKTHLGKPYDLFFLSGLDRIYCSELVDIGFTEGAGIKLGQHVPARQLDLDNYAARKLVARRWQKHPLCQIKDMKFEDCYNVILDQTLITPASIADDKRLQTVYSNFGVLVD
jgi:hypothetical protein